MDIKLLFFGIARDLIGVSSLEVVLPTNCTVTSFKELLKKQHPELNQMSVYAIAINESYATDETVIKNGDIIAVIPPVSGG